MTRMTTNLDNITNTKSINSLIALWAKEAAEWTADRKARGDDEAVTAQQVGYQYCSDFFKYEADNGIRPRWMHDYPVEALAHEYATMYRNAEEAEAREVEGKRKEAEARKPSPAFTMADAFSELA